MAGEGNLCDARGFVSSIRGFDFGEVPLREPSLADTLWIVKNQGEGTVSKFIKPS
jgi:hypothetical protein